MSWIRARLTYSNVVATFALFLVLAGGTVYAANKISGSQIKKNSLAGNRLKSNTVGGKKIKESKLGTVPNAASANAVSGLKVLTPIKRLTATGGATVRCRPRRRAQDGVVLQGGLHDLRQVLHRHERQHHLRGGLCGHQ